MIAVDTSVVVAGFASWLLTRDQRACSVYDRMKVRYDFVA